METSARSLRSRWGRVALAVAGLSGLAAQAAGPHFSPPATRRVDQVDVFHGTTVADPYRWLETDIRQSDEVRAWAEAQNRASEEYLAALPERAELVKRLTELWRYEHWSVPSKVAGRYFFERNNGLQNQSVLYTTTSLESAPEVLIDPNTWAADGTVALRDVEVSPDGSYLVYAVSEAGSDWRTYHVMEVASHRILPDEVHWAKTCCASWTRDSQGFFYGRLPQPEKGTEFQALARGSRIFYHRLGTAQAADAPAHEQPDQPGWSFYGEVPDGGHFLVLIVEKETGERFRILYKDLTAPEGTARVLVPEFTNDYLTPFASEGSLIYFRTDLAAPRGRVVAIDTAHPEREHWRTIIPEARGTLRMASRVGDRLFAQYLEDAVSRVRVYTLDGRPAGEVELPGIGNAGGFPGRLGDRETFFSFSSYNRPAAIYRYDLATGRTSLVASPKLNFQPDDFEVRQVFYPSKDGTKIPMFLAFKKGLPRDGDRPAILTGYGGFNISQTPSFGPLIVTWMERGGVYAVANLRGGGEYGEEWHQAGMKLKKQTVFDDYIAAALWLIQNHYTRPERLAAMGASNGGLLVGAAITQRPELFGAAVPHAGVMDMLRYHLFTFGKTWVHEYGSPDNVEEWKALYSYSPYHNIHPGTAYPATLITTADTDDRVIPGHSFKFAAALQAAQKADKPILLRVETRAGHGAGTPTAKQIAEIADRLAFLSATIDRR